MNVRRFTRLRLWQARQPQIYAAALRWQRTKTLYFGGLIMAVGLVAGVVTYVNRERFHSFLWAIGATYGALKIIESRYVSAWERGLVCIKCGYNLTGNKSGRCPECGTAW